MKIIVPPILAAVLLTDYAPEMLDPKTGKPVVTHVWVNPPRAVIDEHGTLVQAWKTTKAALAAVIGEEAITAERARLTATDDGIAAWYARLWSQHADVATHWTAEEVRVIAEMETDPALYSWLTRRSWELISDHRAGRKKA